MDKRAIEPTRVYTTPEAAGLLGTSEAKIIEAIKKGKLSAKDIGKGWKILGENLINYVSLKTYQIITKEGISGTISASSEEELYQKLSTGNYGVLPLRGNSMIRFTPDNVTEIVELTDEE